MKIAGVSGAWDRPSRKAGAVLVLAHGAGGDLNDPFLAGVAKRLAQAGVAVLRFNFPYRDQGRRAPGAQSGAEDCYRAVATEARETGIPLVCGGKSYGGRIASHIVADGFDLDALVLLSYPLHAPGRPERLRDAHLGRISVPMLFVQGTRDPFADKALLRKTVGRLRSATVVPIEGGDHSLKVRGQERDAVVDRVADEIRAFVNRLG